MTNEQIKQIALANGFNLKEQPDGTMNLHPYVYEFARALIAEHQKSAWISVKERMPEKDGTYLVVYNFETNGTQYPAIQHFAFIGGHFYPCEIEERISYWQPLPTPPQGAENE